MSIDSQIMAPCPGCGMVLPTDLVACTDCLATLPDALRERWSQVMGRHREDRTAYLDTRHAVRSWFRMRAEDTRIRDAVQATGAVVIRAGCDPFRDAGAVQ